MAESNSNHQAQAEDNGMDQQKEREVMVTNQPVREVVVNNEQAPPKLEDREVVVQEEQVRKLRYLGFVQEAVAHALVYLAGLYGVTKDHAGLLRPGVDITESTVKGVVGPIYCKFHGVPLNILAFIDCKVDDMAHKLNRHLLWPLKAASARACAVACAVPVVACELIAEAQQSGVKGAARLAYVKVEPVAKDMYGRYEPVAEQLAVSAWYLLNSLPLFPHVAQVIVPTGAYCMTKYNRMVDAAARQGYTGARYLPTVPMERIAKVFASSAPEAKGAAETQT